MSLCAAMLRGRGTSGGMYKYTVSGRPAEAGLAALACLRFRLYGSVPLGLLARYAQPFGDFAVAQAQGDFHRRVAVLGTPGGVGFVAQEQLDHLHGALGGGVRERRV